jgi:hypothetical protein
MYRCDTFFSKRAGVPFEEIKILNAAIMQFAILNFAVKTKLHMSSSALNNSQDIINLLDGVEFRESFK